MAAQQFRCLPAGLVEADVAGVAHGLPDAPALVLAVDEEPPGARGQDADAETLQLGIADIVWDLRASRASIRLWLRRTLGMDILPAFCCRRGKMLLHFPLDLRLHEEKQTLYQPLRTESAVDGCSRHLGHDLDRGSRCLSIRYAERLAETTSRRGPSDSLARPLALIRGRRTRYSGMGRLVQHPAALGAHRKHPAGRSRGTPLRHTGAVRHGRVTQTRQPPPNLARFSVNCTG